MNKKLFLIMCFLLIAISAFGYTYMEINEDWTGWESNFEFQTGTTYYCDPVNGDISNPGTLDFPWPSLEEVIAARKISRYSLVNYLAETPEFAESYPNSIVKSGDTIILLDGHHGTLSIRGSHNPGFITIKAQNKGMASLSYIGLTSVERYVIDGVKILAPQGSSQGPNAIKIQAYVEHGDSAYLIIENCEIYSIEDSSSWTKQDWIDNVRSGIYLSGNYCIIRNNLLKNINFGITAVGQYVLVQNNDIINFAGDGINGGGHDQIFEYNSVKYCYKINGNHDDGFQSFSKGIPWERTIIRNNIFIAREDLSNPLMGSFQGIGCFDGFYDTWVVENNIIVTNHLHGITFLGVRNSLIINNTLIDYPVSDYGPEIRIGAHKDGTPSENTLVRNNLAVGIGLGEGVEGDANISSEDYTALLVNVQSMDFRPKSDLLIDSGNPEYAPKADYNNFPRTAVDIGALEKDSIPSEPVEPAIEVTSPMPPPKGLRFF